MRNDLPVSVVKYSESPLFDQDTVPDALLRDHNTKAGVWGRIVVTEGALTYLREGRPAQIVSPDKPALIYPEEPHSVQPKGAVKFKVEFYRLPQKEEAA